MERGLCHSGFALDENKALSSGAITQEQKFSP